MLFFFFLFQSLTFKLSKLHELMKTMKCGQKLQKYKTYVAVRGFKLILGLKTGISKLQNQGSLVI